MSLTFSPEDIVVADRSLFPFVYGLREKRPDFAFRLLDGNQLLDLASFSFAIDPIPSLIHKGFSYPNAKRYSQLLRLGLGDADPKAKAFLDELGKDAVKVDPLGAYELSLGKVYFLELEKDIELHSLLRRKGLAPIDIRLEDLGVSAIWEKPTSFLFKNKFSQFSQIFATIREKLLQDKDYAKRCYIQINGLSDVFFARLLGSIFGIETYYLYRAPLLGDPKFGKLYQDLRSRGSLALTEEEAQTDEGKEVLSLIETYGLNDGLDVSVALTRLYEILSSRYRDIQFGDRGILLSDSFSVSGKKDVYLTCFQDGPFYTCYTDDDVFPDDVLLRLGFNPSYVKTSLEKRKKELYLRLNRFALVSRVKEHLDEKIYDSPFLEEFDMKQFPVDKPSTTGVFTSASSELIRGSHLDASFYPHGVGDLKSYSSKFKSIDGYEPKAKRGYSVTNLESYATCPYAYYMKTVLPKTKYDHDMQYLGVFVHKILEGIDRPDYDYESSFDEGVRAYIDEMKKYDEVPGPREEVIFALVKANFKRTASMIRSHNDHAQVDASYSELKLTWTLSDGKKDYVFYGVADKVNLYRNGALTFYTITDYKTGSEEFLPYGCFLGFSTQLPLYAYALTKGTCKNLVEGVFAGMGLQHVYPASLKKTFCDGSTFDVSNGFKFTCIDGAYLNIPDFWDVLDKTSIDGKGKYKNKGVYVNPGKKLFDLDGAGSLSGINNGRPYSLDELIDDAIKGTLDTIHNIEAGRFPIQPTPRDPKADAGDNLPCKYCPYGDICYRDIRNDAISHRNEVEAYFRDKNGGDGDGE